MADHQNHNSRGPLKFREQVAHVAAQAGILNTRRGGLDVMIPAQTALSSGYDTLVLPAGSPFTGHFAGDTVAGVRLFALHNDDDPRLSLRAAGGVAFDGRFISSAAVGYAADVGWDSELGAALEGSYADGEGPRADAYVTFASMLDDPPLGSEAFTLSVAGQLTKIFAAETAEIPGNGLLTTISAGARANFEHQNFGWWIFTAGGLNAAVNLQAYARYDGEEASFGGLLGVTEKIVYRDNHVEAGPYVGYDSRDGLGFGMSAVVKF